MKFLKFKNQRWKMKIGTYAIGLCIPVIEGYISVDKMLEIEAVKNEGLDKIIPSLKKKYFLVDVDEKDVPFDVKKKLGCEKLKLCTYEPCGKPINELKKYCSPACANRDRAKKKKKEQ